MTKRKRSGPHSQIRTEPRQGQRTGRAGRGRGDPRHWLYGVHAVAAALDNPDRTIHRLAATRNAAERLRGAVAARGVAPEILEPQALSALLPPDAVHQGAALLTEPLEPPALEDVLPHGDGAALYVVLDQVTDPQNVGAILRSAAVFGAAAVICQDRHAPPETAALAKAASGGLDLVPLIRVVNLARALATLQEAGVWCIGLDAEADLSLPELEVPPRIAVVMGAEGAGMRRLTAEACDQLARIPMPGRGSKAGPQDGPGVIDSLNVSTAAAIALYELGGRRAAGV